MLKPILILIIICMQFQVNAQFSASAGYRFSFDGIDFHQNHFNAYGHWKRPRRFEFSTGLEFTPKSLAYESREIISDYDHGPPGYSNSETHSYNRTATVNYVYMNVGLFCDWAVVESPDFELLVGFYLQLGTPIINYEKDHETNGRHTYSSEWAGEYTSYTITDPISYSAFEALEISRVNGNFGIKVSPRKYYNQNFIQLNMCIGRTGFKMFKDLRADCGYSTCYDYDFLYYRERPSFASFGISLGRKF